MQDIYLTIYVSNYYAKKILKKDEYNNEVLNHQLFGIESYDCPSMDIYDEEDYYTLTICEDDCDLGGKIALLIMKYTKGKAYCTSGYDEENPKYKYTYQNNKVLVEGYNEFEINTKNKKLIQEFNEISNYLDDYITLSDYEDSYDKVDDFFGQHNADYYNINNIKENISNNNIVTLEWLFIEDYLKILRKAKNKFILNESQPLIFTREYTVENNNKKSGFFSTLFNLFSSNNIEKSKLSWEEEQFEKEAKLWGLSESDKRIAKQERMSPADFIEAEERDDDELLTDD